MGTISTGIELNDNFSSVLYNIMGSVNLAIYQMEEMRQSLSASIDTSYIEGARESIDRATMSLRERMVRRKQMHCSPFIIKRPAI